MRTVQLSTAVFAAIWRERQRGEDSEDAVLARLLKIKPDCPEVQPKSGYIDKRFGVNFPAGFTISRIFKGTAYEVKAMDGKWLLTNTGHTYDSLSAVGDAIKTGIENVWANWFYTDEHGQRKAITNLRDPAKVRRRSRDS